MEKKKDSFYSVKIFLVSLYCIILLGVSFYSMKKALYNWDMLPYMGVVLFYDNIGLQTIHATVYDAAEKEIPTHIYKTLTDSSSKYRTDVAQHAEAFSSQLPFYVVKPLYTRAAWLFYKAGVSLTMSTVLPAVISYFFIGLLLFHWMSRYRSITFSFVASLLIMLSAPLLSVAKISTPDALSALLLFSALFFIVEQRSLAWTFFFLILAVFARLDNVIPAVFIMTAIAFSNKWIGEISKGKYLLFISALVVSYFIISFNAQSFGWSLLYYPNFAKQLNPSYTANNNFVFKEYIALAKSQFMTGLFYSALGFFFLVSLFFVWDKPFFNFAGLTIEQTLVIVFILIILTRFVLQPLISDRLYIPYYLSVIVFMIKKYSLATINAQDYKR